MSILNQLFKVRETLTDETVKKIFGSFKYQELDGGKIKVQADWELKNLTDLKVGQHQLRCHILVVPQFAGALSDIIRRRYEFSLKDGGCFCARHQCWKSKEPLSRHSWGIALDGNVQDNPYGKKPNMNPEIVKVFKRWGFCWGGDFKTPDGMHFEFTRFVYVRDI